MKALGYVALGVIAVGALFGISITIRSVPDIRRYLKIRSM